jgi:fatty acid desaturase 2 (delta-6 desaturase)
MSGIVISRSSNIMGRGGKNSESTLLVDDEHQQQEQSSSIIATSNPKLVENGNDKRQYTWNEIHQNSNKNDRWIVIDKRIYNVARWTKHPGGQAVLKNYVGQDATEAFRALHPNAALVQKYLKTFYVGDLIEDEKVGTTNEQALKNDFEQLRQTAISRKLFDSSRLFFFLTCLHILAFEFAAYFVLLKFGAGWVPYLITLLFYVIAEAQCGWIQHDFGHLSVFKNVSWNHTFHHVFLGLVKGVSTDWWNHMHFQHHSKPNIIDKDPDTRIETVFLLGDTIPIRKAQANAKYGKKMPYNLQHLYFFFTAPLLFPVYFQYTGVRHAVVRRKWADLAWLSLYYVKFLSIMSLRLGLLGAIKLHFLIRLIEGTWFVIVAQSNHVVMDVSHDDSNLPWFRMQLKATCNIEKSPFNDWFTGHLNFQIEHHLFPTMPRHNLYKIQPEVKDLCRKYNIPYVVKPMGRAFLDIITSLEKSGRMWLETYDELIESARTKTT